ncbi:MAG: terminase family protein [bacterium]|nr:terminase family protein [bacterium]
MEQVKTREQELELMQSAMDPIYFINSFCYAYDVMKDKQANITCFDYQERVLDSYMDHKWNVILKSRQTGLSVITACYVAWRMIFGLDETIVIIANNQDGAIRFLKHVKNVLVNLPNHIHGEHNEISMATMKVELANGNTAIAKAAGKQAGRGDSPTLLILDEWAFVKDDEDIWTAAAPSLSQTEGDCIVISTPNGTGNLYHKFWVQASAGDGAFNPIKVHWTENPKSSQNLEYREDSNGILKPWSPWYEDRCKDVQYDGVKIAQELDLSFEGSKLLALDPISIAKQRQRIENEKIQPIMYFDMEVDTRNLVSTPQPCHIYEAPQRQAHYIVACDVAYKGDDYSTIQVIDVDTLNQCAEYQGKCDPDVFAYYIEKIAKYYNQAYVVVEANNHGLVTCFELRNQIKYPRLFESKSTKDIHVRWIDYKVKQGDGVPGFQTTAQSRPGVVNAMREAFRETTATVNSVRLIGEMETFIRNLKKNGREEAEKGYHDDLIMAYGIALYIRQTEYYNVVNAKKMYKSMLEAMTFDTSSYEGQDETPDEKTQRLKDKKEFEENFIPPGAGGLWMGDENQTDDDDPNDLSWLVG